MTRVRTLLTTLIVLAMVSFSFATESHASRGLIIDNPQRKIVGIWVEIPAGQTGRTHQKIVFTVLYGITTLKARCINFILELVVHHKIGEHQYQVGG